MTHPGVGPTTGLAIESWANAIREEGQAVLGHNQTIGAIAHRLCRLIWIILPRGVRYEERGQAVCERLKRIRTGRTIRQLRSLGYRVEPLTVQLNPACGRGGRDSRPCPSIASKRR
jgi:hypothetical protein